MKRGRFIDILVRADTHVGNVFGLWHPDYTWSSGGAYKLNPGQQYLWECWMHFARRLKKGTEEGRFNIVAAVHNGDPIDGKQRAQDQLEAVTTSPVDQADNFEACEREFLKTADLEGIPLYFVQGTEYHDGKGGSEVERVAKSLGGVRYVGIGTGKYSREICDLETGYGITINFCHGIMVSGALYRGVAIDREALWSAIAGKTGKMPKAEVIVRSHAHYYVHIEHEDKHGLITPCWELQTRFMRKGGSYKMLPTLGAVIVRVYEEEAVDADDKVRILKYKYPLPPYRATTLAHAITWREQKNGAKAKG